MVKVISLLRYHLNPIPNHKTFLLTNKDNILNTELVTKRVRLAMKSSIVPFTLLRHETLPVSVDGSGWGDGDEGENDAAIQWWKDEIIPACVLASEPKVSEELVEELKIFLKPIILRAL
jgi:hypothetical protein